MARKSGKPTQSDIGTAMMAWYADAFRQFPGGLVTQAQAATILGLGRMSVSRLVGRGYLRAVYFPKEPDVVGVSIAPDDSTWLKISGWLSIKLGDHDTYGFAKACYVSFDDVVRLWESGDARKKCKRDWNEIMAGVGRNIKDAAGEKRQIQGEYKKRAAEERRQRSSGRDADLDN